jgi:hypothetical protein
MEIFASIFADLTAWLARALHDASHFLVMIIALAERPIQSAIEL